MFKIRFLSFISGATPANLPRVCCRRYLLLTFTLLVVMVIGLVTRQTGAVVGSGQVDTLSVDTLMGVLGALVGI